MRAQQSEGQDQLDFMDRFVSALVSIGFAPLTISTLSSRMRKNQFEEMKNPCRRSMVLDQKRL